MTVSTDMKDRRFASEYSSSLDGGTGAVVHQLTSYPSVQHATYFLQSSITPDGKCLLFTSYRSNAPQLYSVEPYPRGEIRQWTSGPPIHPFSATIHPSGARVFFVRGGEVWEIDRETLAERKIVSFPETQLGELSLSAGEGTGDDWLCAAAKQGTQPGIVSGRADGADWRFIPFPRTVIHPQFHPLDREWIEFAADPAPRMHRVRRDGSSKPECLYLHGNDEFVVHETFLGGTGDLVYTVWPFALWRMNWHSRERTKICDFNAWHITPNRAGTLVLCDTNYPDLGIHLIEVATGRRRRICESRASNQGSQWRTSRYALAADFAAARTGTQEGKLSWMEVASDTVYGPQWTHPHPSFSPDESIAVFTSDRTGHPQVYSVEIPNLDRAPWTI